MSLLSTVSAAARANPRRLAVLVVAALVTAAMSAGMAGAYGLRSGGGYETSCYGDYNVSAACQDAMATDTTPHVQLSYDNSPYVNSDTNFYGYGYTQGQDNPAVSYEWQFDDGAPITDTPANDAGSHQTHQFTTVGDHEVKLTVTFADNSHAHDYEIVHVAQTPEASVELSYVNTIQTGASQQYTAYAYDPVSGSHTPTSWDWNWGDGSAHSTTATPSHTYASDGRHPVTVTADFGGGRQATAKMVVVTGPNRAPSVSWSASGQPVTGTPVGVYGSIDYGTSTTASQTAWSFTFDDEAPVTGTTGQPYAPSHTFTGAGVHHISLDVTFSSTSIGNNGHVVVTEPIYVQPSSGATTTVFTNGTDAGSNLSFFASNTGGTTAVTKTDWWFGDN